MLHQIWSETGKAQPVPRRYTLKSVYAPLLLLTPTVVLCRFGATCGLAFLGDEIGLTAKSAVGIAHNSLISEGEHMERSE